MLKLEKNRQSGISVSFRSREKWVNRTLFYAFLLAASIHLTAALLFQIHSYLVTDDHLLPPTIVEADSLFSDAENETVVTLNEQENSQKFNLAPVLSTPQIPLMPLSNSREPFEIIEQTHSYAHRFPEIEEDWQYLIDQKQQKLRPPLQIKISGQLASIPLLNDGTQNIIPALETTRTRLSYEVQLENATGIIFWYMSKGESENSYAHTIADKVIRNIRFKPNQTDFVTVGEIEIILETS